MSDNDNVVDFPGTTTLDLDPDKLLEAAKGKLEGVVITGYTKDGDEYYAASFADGGEVLWLLKRFEHLLMQLVDEL